MVSEKGELSRHVHVEHMHGYIACTRGCPPATRTDPLWQRPLQTEENRV
jgi:hypothetical protein